MDCLKRLLKVKDDAQMVLIVGGCLCSQNQHMNSEEADSIAVPNAANCLLHHGLESVRILSKHKPEKGNSR